jgi:phytoene synthase
LPLEDLERFGYGEEDLASGVVDDRLVALMRFEIERARKLYAYADEGIEYIPRGRRWPVVVARELYAGILGRIEARDYDVFSTRAETSRPRKLLVAARVAARDPREILTRFTSRG